MLKILSNVLILILIFLNITAVAADTKTRVFSDENSKDFRVDSDKNGTLDLWKSSDDNVSITAAGKTGNREITVTKRNEDETVDKIFAEEKNGKISVKKYQVLGVDKVALDGVKSFSYEKQFKICNDLVQNKFKDFSAELSTFGLRKNAKQLWSKECHEIPEFDKISHDFQNAIIETFKVDSDKNNTLMKCLDELQVKSEKIPSYNQKINILILEAKSAISDFYNGAIPEGILTCTKDKVDSITSLGGKKIKIGINDGSGFDPRSKLRNSFQASLLAGFDIPQDVATKMSETCLAGNFAEMDVVAKGAFQKNSKGNWYGTAADVANSANSYAIKNASDKELVAINKNLAETKVNIPSAEETSPRALAAIERTQGPAAAATVARAQSSSLMGAANTIMGAVNTPAVAQSRGLASTSAPRKVDTLTLSKSNVGTKANVGNVKSAQGLQPGEEIVEEYLADGTGMSQTGRNANTVSKTRSAQSASRLPAAVNSEQPVAAASAGQDQAGSGSEAGGSSGGADIGRSGSSGGSRFSPSSSTPDNPINARTANRAAAARSPSSVALTPRQEELASFLSNKSYNETVTKLRDAKFVRTLAENSITVIDRNLASYGAERGSVIFVERGGRFVQKSKK